MMMPPPPQQYGGPPPQFGAPQFGGAAASAVWGRWRAGVRRRRRASISTAAARGPLRQRAAAAPSLGPPPSVAPSFGGGGRPPPAAPPPRQAADEKAALLAKLMRTRSPRTRLRKDRRRPRRGSTRLRASRRRKGARNFRARPDVVTQGAQSAHATRRPSHAVVENPLPLFLRQVTGPWCFFQAVEPADAPWVDPVLSLACHMAIFAATPVVALASDSRFSSKKRERPTRLLGEEGGVRVVARADELGFVEEQELRQRQARQLDRLHLAVGHD